MRRVVLDLYHCEGFLGGSTTSVLRVTEREDGSISLAAGTISEECLEVVRYWQKGITGIRTIQKLEEVLPKISTSLGGSYDIARKELYELGLVWDNKILKRIQI
jgi:hypothetical protein